MVWGPHGAPFISCRLIFFDDIGSFSRCLRVLMSLGGVLKWAKTSILRCFRGIIEYMPVLRYMSR